MKYQIHPLDAGDMDLDSSFLSWQSGIGKSVLATTTAWLVLGADKPILVDTSFRSVEDAKRLQGLTCHRSESQTMQAQLRRFGLAPEDIGYIIHTHVHMDHAGQDYLFPNARIFLQRGELQNAAAPNICPVPFYDRLNTARLVNDLWSQLELQTGDEQPFAGIRCELLPGHTPWHQIVRVDTAAGEYWIIGDAAMLVSNVRNQWAPGFIDSMTDTMTGLRKLKPYADRLLPTHDRAVSEKFREGIG
jgi:N-acyl homoserine lactone hydrolase